MAEILNYLLIYTVVNVIHILKLVENIPQIHIISYDLVNTKKNSILTHLELIFNFSLLLY